MHCETPHSGTVFARFWVIVNELSKTWRQLGRHEGSGFFSELTEKGWDPWEKGSGSNRKGLGSNQKGLGSNKKGLGSKKKGLTPLGSRKKGLGSKKKGAHWLRSCLHV